jgi:hypothetical protein
MRKRLAHQFALFAMSTRILNTVFRLSGLGYHMIITAFGSKMYTDCKSCIRCEDSIKMIIEEVGYKVDSSGPA